jgi:hypothetical protein
MRPYLAPIAVVFFAVAAFGQQPGVYFGGCYYACGPFVPRLTTPEISLQQASENPVGASNATTGLIAGATNSTLSQAQGSTNSVYTEPVWYQGGGAPLISTEVRLAPEPVGREGRPMVAERFREAPEPRYETHVSWTYITGKESTSSAAQAANGKAEPQPGHVYGNDDVSRQNEKNGVVNYAGKTEKI